LYFSTTNKSDKNHSLHLRAGNWIWELLGIYRLARYPLQDDTQYTFWGIWASGRQDKRRSDYSYGTALSLFGLNGNYGKILQNKNIQIAARANYCDFFPLTLHFFVWNLEFNHSGKNFRPFGAGRSIHFPPGQ